MFQIFREVNQNPYQVSIKEANVELDVSFLYNNYRDTTIL